MAEMAVDSGVAPLSKRRMTWGKVIGWGLLLVVMGLVLFEGSAVYFYQSSLSGLDAAISASRKPGKAVGVPFQEIRKHLSGFPIQEESKEASGAGAVAKAAGVSKRRRVGYHWPSLFTKFRLVATVDEKENVIGVEGEYAGEEKKQIPLPVLTPPVVEAKGVVKQAGLGEVPEGAVVLGLDELKVMGSLRRLRCGSLAREMFRQAVLIAARDEIGADTLDVVLGEVELVSDNPKRYPLQVDVLAEADPKLFARARFVMKLTRLEPGGEKFEWTSEPSSIPLTPTMDVLLEKAEEMSRGELVKGLQAGGYQKSEAKGEALSEPAGCEWRMDVVSQFARLRQLHSERRVKGETVENLGALVRAYANLGELTEHHWSPMSKGLRARALLYANRMIAKHGKTAATLGHRAYAWTLAGNHGLALVDLKGIEELKSKDQPEWLPLISAVCEYKPEVMEKVSGNLKELALYLRMRTLDPARDSNRTLGAIGEMLTANPVCWRGVERMCETRKLGTVRRATEGVAERLWPAVYPRLMELPGLPENVKTIAQRMSEEGGNKIERPVIKSDEEGDENEAEIVENKPSKEHEARLLVITELYGAKKRSEVGAEPGWRTLGEMMNDATFVQAWRVLDVARNWLGIAREELGPTVKSVMPMVRLHRFGKYLLCFAVIDPKETVAGLLEIYKNTPGTMYEMQCLPLANVSSLADPEYYIPLCSHIDNHWERVQGDLLRAQDNQFVEWGKEARDLLLKVTPNQPTVVMDSLFKTPNFEGAVAAEWEKRCAQSPYMMKELGRKYQGLGKSVDAIRCFERSIEMSPSHGAYEGLAAEYQKLGNLEAAEVVLEEAMKLPAQGLEQSHASMWLAYLLMRKGNWERAMEYAEEAAGSYSGNGLLVAARGAEGLGEWGKAEEYIKAVSERYEWDADDWYFWCVRTGKGNIEEAKKLAEARWKTYDTPPQKGSERWSMVTQLMLEGKEREMLQMLVAKIYWDQKDVRQAVLAGLVSERLKLPDLRDRVWSEFIAEQGPHTYLVRLIYLFKRAMRDPKQLQWSKAAFEEFIDDFDGADVPLGYYMAGEFLESHGEHKLSEEYLRVAATTFDVQDRFCLLSTIAMRKRKLAIGESRENDHPDERMPGIKLVNRATLLRSDKKYAEARKDVDAAIKKVPNFVLGYLARARLNQMEGKFREAVADYREALRLNPDSEQARVYLATVLAGCEKDEIRNGKEAATLVEEAIGIRGASTPWFDSVLAMAEAEKGDFKKAVELLEGALKKWPDMEEWKEMLKGYKGGKVWRFSEKDLPWSP